MFISAGSIPLSRSCGSSQDNVLPSLVKSTLQQQATNPLKPFTHLCHGGHSVTYVSEGDGEGAGAANMQQKACRSRHGYRG